MRAAILAILVSACTTVMPARRSAPPGDVDAINRVIANHEITVTTAAKSVTAIGGEIGVGTASWIEPPAQARKTVPIAALQRIELPRQRGIGALEGAGLGLLAGAAAGIVAGLASGDDKCAPGQWCFFTFTAGQKAEIGAMFFGATGLLVGAITGAIIGHRTEIEFQ